MKFLDINIDGLGDKMNNYRGTILESFYMIDIPTNPEELATLLDNYALVS